MKERIIRFLGRLTLLFIPLIFLYPQIAGAQTKYLLPLGDSITWGKSNKVAPPPGQYGYRDHLYGEIHNYGSYTIDFVGSIDDGNYDGWFFDGAFIEEFLTDSSSREVIAMIDGLVNKPDYICLHLGTNDIGSLQPVGDYLTQGSIARHLWLLLNELLGYRRSDPADSIEHIFLCKIIPAAPFGEWSGFNAKILDYNSKIQQMYENLGNDQARVTLIDMHSPFYANQSTYYTADNDPGTDDDNVHPSQFGYEQMAGYFADNIKDYLSQYMVEVDEFDRAPALMALHGSNNWNASGSIKIMNVGESGGGAIYSTTAGGDWDMKDVAIWNTTLGMNSISMKIHNTASLNADTLSGVGLLVGMNNTDVNNTDGYLVFVRFGTVHIYVIDGSEINKEVAHASFPNWTRDSVFKVTYVITHDGRNAFYVSLNGGTETVLTSDISLLERGVDYYSGVMFRGNTAGRLLLDNFKSENQFRDVIPPAKITLFTLSGATTNNSVTLQWWAVGDDGAEQGTRASSYDLRYSTHPINETNFDDAFIVPSVPPPQNAGIQEFFTIKALMSGARYYFAIKAVDRYGNPSPLSEDIDVRTTSEGQVPDEFDRSVLGNNWVYNQTEYAINTNTHELINQLNDGDFGTMALFKGLVNLSTVKMVWGQNVQNPSFGDGTVDNGGFVFLADDSSLTADGYFAFIRTTLNLIYLFDIKNGEIGTNYLDAVSYNLGGLGRVPGAMDTLAVVMDVSEEETVPSKFNVYVHFHNGDRWEPASRFALYDKREVDDRHGFSDRNYAGVILARLNGIRNNNLASFIPVGEETAPAGIVAVGPTNLGTGVVNTWLQDSAAVCVVQVQNESHLPVKGIPVFFQVTQGGGEVSAPYASDGNIRIEAEWGNPESPMLVFNDDKDASGEKYIKSIQPAYIAQGSATYRFYIEKPGVYYFWGRVKNVEYWKRWLFGFEIVGISPEGGVRWEVLRNEQAQGQITGNWQWDAVQEEGRNYAYAVEFVQPALYTLKIWNMHSDVYLDKIIITNQTDFMPVGQETIPTLYSDVNGEVATAWRLGKVADDPTTPSVNEGLNRVVARTFASGETVTFTAYALAANPDSIVKLSDNLSGASGDTLVLSAVFYDKFGNRASNKNVKFEVIQGDAWWAASPNKVITVLTNSMGQASPKIVLGVDSTSIVRVYFDGYTGPQITITVNVTPGQIATILNGTSQDQKFYVETLYPNFLKVTVKNAQGNPVPNVLVRFEVVTGQQFTTATLSQQPVWSNASGIATASLTTGKLAGILKIKARTSGMESTVVNDSVFYRVTAIGYKDGGKETLGFGETSKNPLRVWCSAEGLPAKNIPVTYRITNSSIGFTFQNGSQIYVDTTGNSGGLEGVTNKVYIKAGTVHGKHDKIVEASASDGFNPVPYIVGGKVEAAVYFDFDVKSTAYALQSQPYDPVGTVRGNVGPLSVKLVKLNGTPVGGQYITFKRISGNGSFDSETALDKRIVKGDTNGYAAVFYWLGDKAGVNNNKIRAYTVNVEDTLSTTFTFSANSSKADSLYAVSPVAFTDTVGNANTIEVKLKDIGGNVVENQEVFFKVTGGGGHLNGTQTDSLMRSTNGNGVASVIWTLGKTAGVNTNVLRVTSTVDGVNALKGAPLYFRATTVPDRVNGHLTTIQAKSPVQSVINDTCTITVTLRDGFSNVVPNKSVKIVVQGPGPNFWDQNPAPSNAQGKVTSYLLSETPGEKRIRAIVDKDTLANDTTVVFLANDATRLQEYSGNNQIGNVNTVLRYPFVVEVTDKNGYTPNGSVAVYFTAIGGKGKILETQPVMSDTNGFARATLKLDAAAGVYSVQAASAGLQGTATFWATGKTGTAAHMFYGDDYTQAEGQAGEILSRPFMVKVVDSDSLAIAGESVTFVLNPTEGSNGSIIESQPVKTNERGLAQIHFRNDTRAGFESWIYTEKPPLTTNKIWFRATSTAGTARKIVAVSSKEQDVHVGESVTLQVKVTDAHGNVKSGIQVGFKVMAGDAVVIQGASTQTNASGIAAATILLGTHVGIVKVWATPAGTMLEGSPVEFTINAVTRNQDAANIIRFPASKDTVFGTVNKYLVDSLRVRVIDVYQNPVAGQTVIFSLTGQGSIDGDGRETSDANGIASIAYKCGSASNTISTVRAEWGSSSKKTVPFIVKAVSNPHSPVLDDNYFANSYNIKENEYPPLKIKMVAKDEDPNDKLKFGIADLFYPEEMLVYPETNSDSSALFEWSPTFKRGKNEPYFITLRVTDGRGGSDEKTVRIFVQDISQLPVIVEKYPAERKVSTTAGSTVAFWVVAENADNDPMQYSWRVDKQSVGTNNPVYYHHVNENFTGKQLVDVLVMDEHGAADPTKGWFEWELNVTTAVELAEFSAQFDVTSSCVHLQWSTSHEVDNCGFDIYRSHDEESGYIKINEGMIPSSQEGEYSYTDRDVGVGITYYYKLVSVDISGNQKEYGPVMVKIPLPDKLDLSQNYPNPFNPVTTIQYTVPTREHISLIIYNMLGQRVVKLVDEEKSPGYYTAEWDGKDSHGLDVATGIYIYRLTGKLHSKTLRMIKLR